MDQCELELLVVFVSPHLADYFSVPVLNSCTERGRMIVEAIRADCAAVATELAQARDKAVRRANRKRALVRLVQESTEKELDKLIQNTMHLSLQEVTDEMRVRIELRTQNRTGANRWQHGGAAATMGAPTNTK